MLTRRANLLALDALDGYTGAVREGLSVSAPHPARLTGPAGRASAPHPNEASVGPEPLAPRLGIPDVVAPVGRAAPPALRFASLIHKRPRAERVPMRTHFRSITHVI